MSTLFRRSLYGLAIFVILVTVSAMALSSVSHGALASSGFTFKNFELSANPGTDCPGSTLCYNVAAEPQIRANKEGYFFASSENGLTAGTDAWKSEDGGRHYDTLVSPNQVSANGNNFPFAPAGGDTDLAIAPVINPSGNYNVYVASLNLASVDVSTSKNEGVSWIQNPTSATVPIDDREWIAADMMSKVCISYHEVVTAIIHVDCSYDAGTTFTQHSTAFDTTHAPIFVQNNMIGNMAIDPNNHYIYQTWSSVHDVSEVPGCQSTGCSYHTVWMGVSTDGGNTFTDYVVYNNPNTSVGYGHQFVNVSIDKAGNVYSVFSDNHNVYYSYSKDHGVTWSAPVQVNKSPSNTAIFPWSTANKAGHIDIVWYGTSYYDGVNPPDSYPSTAAWYVYMAQSLNATSPNSGFTQTQVTPIIHYGGVCEGGVTCTGNRDLYDDFGVAANPRTGLASIIYSDDQYTNDPNNPPAGTNCTPAASNSVSCDHTSVATQTAGPGI